MCHGFGEGGHEGEHHLRGSAESHQCKTSYKHGDESWSSFSRERERPFREQTQRLCMLVDTPETMSEQYPADCFV